MVQSRVPTVKPVVSCPFLESQSACSLSQTEQPHTQPQYWRLSVLQFAGTKRQIAEETTLPGPNLEWKQQKAQKSLNAAKQQRQKNAGGECQRGDICKSHQTLNSCHDDDDEYDDNGEHDNNNDNDDDDNDNENDDYGGRKILAVNMKEETCVNPARL